MTKILELLIQALVEVSLLSSIIVVIYFFYGKKVEATVIDNQSTYIVNSLKNELVFENLPKVTNPKPILTESQLSDLENSNNDIENLAFKYCIIGTSTGLILAFLLCMYFKLNTFEIFAESAVVVTFVGITEMLFLTFVASNYILVDFNDIKRKIISNLNT
jgi:hypothetical protein